ncbi:MAG: hypothetical protein AB1705_05065 [Verrucomicrobiota bacterium]
MDVSLIEQFNHLPIRLPVTNLTEAELGNLVVMTDAAWVTPSVNIAESNIVLSFATSNLSNSTSTATITASHGGQNVAITVRATKSAQNITQLRDDPLRSRTYGIHQTALTNGSVVILDPITTNFIGNITVGRKPTDLAESADGRELFVINSVEKSISVIDLEALEVKETIALPVFENTSEAITFASVTAGPGNVLYYTDGASDPVLRVLDRNTRQVLQTVTAAPGGRTFYGIVDTAITSDHRLLFARVQQEWNQNGWSVEKYAVAPSGLLTLQEARSATYSEFFGEPVKAPVLISRDDQRVFVMGHVFGTNSVWVTTNNPSGLVYSITPRGELAASQSSILDTQTGSHIAFLPKFTSVHAISSDYSRLIYFDPGLKTLKVRNFYELVAPKLLSSKVSPSHGVITLIHDRLEWPPVPGINRYRVYLATLESLLTSETFRPLTLVGETTEAYYQYSNPLPDGTYFWQVEAVTDAGVVRGDILSFTASSISSTTNQVTAVTMKGDRALKASFGIASSSPVMWRARADKSWITFVQTNGTTPATVEIVMDTSQLAVGTHQATITINNGANPAFSIPLTLQVDPFVVTRIRSDPELPFVYAISEDTTANPRRAYLIELNTLTESIRRVTKVGSYASDLAIHKGENRIYVPNSTTGRLLAVDFDAFEVIRNSTFSSRAGNGHRVAPGNAGRLIWEAGEGWSDLNILDTFAGTNVASFGFSSTRLFYKGGGAASPDKRYYYHGDTGTFNNALHKYDLQGDTITEVKSSSGGGIKIYGSDVVVVPENGNRVFWNGRVFDLDLELEWTFQEEIFAATPDGRYAFGSTSIYDMDQKALIGTVSPPSSIKAYNAFTGKLVSQVTNGVSFYRLNSSVQSVPANGSTVLSPPLLTWPGVPGNATYRVYLGQQATGINFLAETAATTLTLSAFPPGTYQWRVDTVTEYGTMLGVLNSFTIAPVTPSVPEIRVATYPGRVATAELGLNSASAEVAWQAIVAAPWISLSSTNGQGPATLRITIDESKVPAGSPINISSIKILSDGRELFVVPVYFMIDPLRVTVIKADPLSGKAYAISEDTSRSPSRAYLLEINTETESVGRMLYVGYTATDLAIHPGDGRIYVPDRVRDVLLAIDKDSFQQVRSYPIPPEYDFRRVSGAAPGQLVLEGDSDGVVMLMVLFDTAGGTVRSRYGGHQCAGAFGENGRFYYRGDFYGFDIRKYEVLGVNLVETAQFRATNNGTFGPRTVVVSHDSSRVFWNGSMFNANLSELWKMPEEVFSTSVEGRYAFSATNVYDTVQMAAVLTMPANPISTFNSHTRKIVTQIGGDFRFFDVTQPFTLPTPTLFNRPAVEDRVELFWTDDSLENSFAVQMRVAGTDAWQDVATLAANITNYTVTGMVTAVTYEFRLKADGYSISSDWSPVLSVTSPSRPPVKPSLNVVSVTHNSVSLAWPDVSGETQYVLERRLPNPFTWSVLATLTSNTTAYTDTAVTPYWAISYRLKAVNAFGSSPYSATNSASIPGGPEFFAKVLSNSTVEVRWNRSYRQNAYRLERRTQESANWSTLVTLTNDGSSVGFYVDTNVVQGVTYVYRVMMVDASGELPYPHGPEVIATPGKYFALLEDNFDPQLDTNLWASVAGGTVTNGVSFSFHNGNALKFHADGAREAVTTRIPIDSPTVVEFYFRTGYQFFDGAGWNDSEPGENVVVEYSIDGTNWVLATILDTPFHQVWPRWRAISTSLPTTLVGQSAQIRWRQLGHSGSEQDVWAIDDVRILDLQVAPLTPPPFIFASPASATSIAVLWFGPARAQSHELERRQSDGLWIPLVTLPAWPTFYMDTSAVPATAYAYRVKALNNGHSSAYSAEATATTWGQQREWLLLNYGSDALTNEVMYAVSADGSRPIIRYAFNLGLEEPLRRLVPNVSRSGLPAIWIDRARDRICVELVRRKAQHNPGIRYGVEFSTDLVSWHAINSAAREVSVVSLDTIWERVRIEDEVAVGDFAVRFCRVTVTPDNGSE